MNKIFEKKLVTYKLISYHFFAIGIVYCLLMVVLTSASMLIGLELVRSKVYTGLFIVAFLSIDTIFYILFRKFCHKIYDDILVLLFFDYTKGNIYSAFRHVIRKIGIKMTLAIVIFQTVEIVMILGFQHIQLMIEGYLFVIANSILLYEALMYWVLKPYIYSIDTIDVIGL